MVVHALQLLNVRHVGGDLAVAACFGAVDSCFFILTLVSVFLLFLKPALDVDTSCLGDCSA